MVRTKIVHGHHAISNGPLRIDFDIGNNAVQFSVRVGELISNFCCGEAAASHLYIRTTLFRGF